MRAVSGLQNGGCDSYGVYGQNQFLEFNHVSKSAVYQTDFQRGLIYLILFLLSPRQALKHLHKTTEQSNHP